MTATAGTIDQAPQPIIKARKPQAWDKAKSQEMARRSAAVRAARKAQCQLNPSVKPKPDPASPNDAETLPKDELPELSHGERRLARVRRQLDRLDAMLLREKDPAKLDRLAAASAKLEEQERRLSNRSLPATVRLDSKRPGRSPGLMEE